MKKIIAALTLFVTSMVSYAGAGDYVCGMKRTQREVDECYNLIVRGGQVRMQKNYDRISASPKVTQEEKQHINKNHAEWAQAVDRKCRNNSCVYDALSNRNNEIEQFMRQHGLQPI